MPVRRCHAVLLTAFTLLAAGAVPASAAVPAGAAVPRTSNAGFHWSSLRSSPLGPRSQPDLVWTGRELIELGGMRKSATTNDGAAYVPATGRWHKIAQVRGNVGFWQGVTAWTGRELFVTNGVTASCTGGEPVTICLPRAGLYNPVTNRWTTTPLPRPMDNLAPAAAVWTGRDIVLASVRTNRQEIGVASYDPAAGRWQMITPRLPAKHPILDASLVAAGDRLVLWSLWSRSAGNKNGTSLSWGVDVLARHGTGNWRDVTGNWPQDQTVPSPVPADRTILVSPGQFWCGDLCPGPFEPFDGYFVNPVTLHRSIIPGGPLIDVIPSFVWTGSRIIAVNLDGETSGPSGPQIRPDDLALYNPATSRWFKLPAPPHRPDLDTIPVWASSELLTLTTKGALLGLRS
jgi:hypothetical protein